jgi:hypothetical protein
MALTQGAWTETSVNGMTVFSCDVTATVSENDAYTLKTPVSLDGSKAWTLHVNTAGATLDGSALPVDVWGGWSDDFALTGDAGTVAATDGGETRSAVIDDVKGVANAVIVDPSYTGAAVQSTLAGVRGIVNAGVYPYYAINLDGASTLAAATCTFKIVQAQTKVGGSTLGTVGGIGADPS